MSYQDALARLLSSPTTPKLGLERMTELLRRLGDPQRMPSVHVAGTKGKGSACAFTESILRASGLRTGLTTSPHLSTARERIAIDGEMISETAFVELEERVRGVDEGLSLSFFERTIAMAWLAFRDARVDVAVVEVGLGGRLDATNVIEPLACAVTRLGLDHTEHLGPTIIDIAREKAGIMKRSVPVVSPAPPAQPHEARGVLVEHAARVGAPLTFVDVDDALTPSLAGAHQRENASVAVALVRAAESSAAARGLAWPRTDDVTVREGLARARWPGRYEVLRERPLLVIDGAHNATAASALADTIARDERVRGARRLEIVIGMTGQRDAVEFGAMLAPLHPTRVWAVAAPSPRTREPRALAEELMRGGLGNVVVASLADALGQAQQGVGPDGGVVVCGSLYVVGEVRHMVLGGPRDPQMPAF